ncbi:hypothetical protein SAMN03159494_00956 [Achromobacter sp. NFACC18-2]|nr:hypothetical protein SAMN03159494_00956 [Achromobacter sp. NFACC18-2]
MRKLTDGPGWNSAEYQHKEEVHFSKLWLAVPDSLASHFEAESTTQSTQLIYPQI